MKLTDKQLEAAKLARQRWGAFFLLGPSDLLPSMFLIDVMNITRKRAAKKAESKKVIITDEELDMLKKTFKDVP